MSVLRYRREFNKGLIDHQRVPAVTQTLLGADMPAVKVGVLYLDGDGTASAAVAESGAEVFNKGWFTDVVFAGGKRPWFDPMALGVFPMVRADGMKLPRFLDTEADYLLREFAAKAEPFRFNMLRQSGRVHVMRSGTNTGAKVKACREIFNKVGLVQVVTLAYLVPRVVGTIAKETDNVAVTAQGVFPFGITRENWADQALPYAVVMDEADKFGPRFDGKPPAYEDYYERTDLEKMGRLALEREPDITLDLSRR